MPTSIVASLEQINARSQARKIKGNKIMDVLEPILMSSVVSSYTEKEITMLYYALVFFVVALIAGVLGFGGIAGASASIAQVLFFIFLVLLVISLVMRVVRRP
ncbi:Uncharacterized membrane protein YtjA, UPF0391 family [Rhizobium lusitanum]|uniref:UPF0391 membrane protein GA0061101_107224 n=2 Tax=Rhizobium/Agrobacterium group TaxID=227290 RepID=A0A1C3W0B7_9HYPH|nr:Uncharacterized membrane protein YtjA, UPF0391 family [Rhizobium lusitanum]